MKRFLGENGTLLTSSGGDTVDLMLRIGNEHLDVLAITEWLKQRTTEA
jgi:prophage maintenance system killer protein